MEAADPDERRMDMPWVSRESESENVSSACPGVPRGSRSARAHMVFDASQRRERRRSGEWNPKKQIEHGTKSAPATAAPWVRRPRQGCPAMSNLVVHAGRLRKCDPNSSTWIER